MANEKKNDKDSIIKLVGLLGQLVDVMSEKRTDGPNTAEKIKKRLREMADIFIEVNEMKEKSEPILHEFLHDFNRTGKDRSPEVCITQYFPELEAHFEAHAIMNLQTHLMMAGPFGHLKEETIAKIMDEQQIAIFAVIEYLNWRSRKLREGQAEH